MRDGVPGYHDGLGYLFIDFNAFFASVEQLDDPALQGRPVIVLPHESEASSAIAVSYEARDYGIRRGTKAREARELCPEVIIRPARHDRYVAIHKQIKDVLGTVVPIQKVYSVDEMACRLAPSEATAARAVPLALRVKEVLRETIGPALRGSIGLAQTRLLAKLAAERQKPDGLTVLEPSDLPHKLHGIDIASIPGIGASMVRRLERANICSFQELWDLEPKKARRIWGSVAGERFWYALHGWETDEPDTKRSMIGHSRVLDRRYENPEGARRVAHALMMKAAARLRRGRFRARTVTLRTKLRGKGDKLPGYEGGMAMPLTQDSYACLAALDALWEDQCAMLTRDLGTHALRFGHVAIFLTGLVAEDEVDMQQQDLFAEPRKTAQKSRREELWRLVDAINTDKDGRIAALGSHKRRGPAVGRYVTLAAQNGLDLNYLGGKIAFSRVPDEAEFMM
ncbi:MAG: impB/mucB/samB family protein [Pseudomonadota bacterium]